MFCEQPGMNLIFMAVFRALQPIADREQQKVFLQFSSRNYLLKVTKKPDETRVLLFGDRFLVLSLM